MRPFKEFSVESDDELLGTYRVIVKPAPDPAKQTWSQITATFTEQEDFIRDAIREKLERQP